MNKEKLQRLRKMKRERDSLLERLKKNAFNPKVEVADTVKDYRTGVGKTITIHGYGNADWKRLQMKYSQKAGDLTREILLMEIFLDKVEDPEMRQILRYRYEDGMTHEQIAEKMGYSRTAIQKKEERFWNEQEEVEQ